jgi:hypothetical protein
LGRSGSTPAVSGGQSPRVVDGDRIDSIESAVARIGKLLPHLAQSGRRDSVSNQLSNYGGVLTGTRPARRRPGRRSIRTQGRPPGLLRDEEVNNQAIGRSTAAKYSNGVAARGVHGCLPRSCQASGWPKRTFARALQAGAYGFESVPSKLKRLAPQISLSPAHNDAYTCRYASSRD